MKIASYCSIILLAFLGMTQIRNVMPEKNYPSYSAEWEKINQLQSQGLRKDVINLVEQLLARAERKNNLPQQYKCIMTLEAQLIQSDEDGVKGFITRIEKKKDKAKEPIKSLLSSVLGSAYKAVYSQSLYGGARSNITAVEQDEKDIETWSPEALILKANENFLNSVKIENSLDELNIDLKEIQTSQGDSMSQPYLYDMLLFRAINHFSEAQSQLPNVKSPVSREILFSTIDEFLNYKLQEPKEPQEMLVQLFQDAIRYHKGKENHQAVIYYDLQRLKTFYAGKSDSGSKKAYIYALHSLFEKYKNKEYAGEVLFAEGELYYTRYFASAEEHDLLHCDSIMDVILKKYPSCKKAEAASKIKAGLYEKKLGIDFEEVALPQQPIKIQVEFRNTNKLVYKIYKVNSDNRYKQNRFSRNQNFDVNKDAVLVRTKEEIWNEQKAILNHRIDIKVDALDFGLYFIAASYEEFQVQVNDNYNDKNYVSGFFQVSNLAHFIVRDQIGSGKIATVDRTTGEPIEGVSCELYRMDYGNAREEKAILSATVKSNKHGFVELNSKETYNYFILKKGNDQFYSAAWMQFHADRHHEYVSPPRTLLFTDRSLYRPGQIIFFKGLHLDHGKNNIPKIRTAASLTIRLIDVNGNEVTKKAVVTSEFGTFAGEFAIPMSGLKGSYSIMIGEDYIHQIQVEEYKRPKFEVLMDTVKESFVAGDDLIFSGSVMSFSGVPLDKIQANYRVVRVERVLYFPCWFYYRGHHFSPKEEEIENASLTTDANGKFSIKVKSTKFEEGSVDLQKVYQYRLTIDALDKNGETQTGESLLQVSNNPFVLKTNLKNVMISSQLKSLQVETENLNAVKVDADLEIKIYELEAPKEVFRPRLFAKPDVFKYAKEEYKSWFPYDVYNDEDDMSTWTLKSLVFQKDVKSNGIVDLDLSSKCSSISYKIEIVAKRNGKVVELKDYFSVLHAKEQYTYLTPMIYQQEQKLTAGTSGLVMFPRLNNPYYIYQYKTSFSKYSQEWKKIQKDNEWKISADENDKGGIQFGFACVFQNRFYNVQNQIEVPWEKELSIVSKSFREKVLPGSQEEWTFSVSSKNLPESSAELVASMYDVSLDKIYPHQWSGEFFPSSYQRMHFESNVGNKIVARNNSGNHWVNYNLVSEFYELNLFGCEFISQNNMRYLRAMPAGAVFDSEMTETKARSKSKMEESPVQDAAKGESSLVTSPPVVRKNLAETVFFYPFLKTDKSGNVEVKFTMNEALTKWKLNLFAHTKDLKTGFASFDVVTWKPIQVQPNYPRFFRQGDAIELNTKVSNVSESNEQLDVAIDIIDLHTNKSILQELNVANSSQQLVLLAHESKSVTWKLNVPKDEIRSYIVRFTAAGKTHSDGEESIIPVLSNRMLVTETLPLPVKGKQTKVFDISQLTKSIKSSSAIPHSLTIERTSHPVWYAVQALPYIMEYPHQCAEQTMSRFYANALGAKIMTQFPKVSQVLKSSNSQLQSPLEKNKELKSALLEETPWLHNAKSESEQMAQIALLMDLNKMSIEKEQALSKLDAMQYPNGGFPWMEGGQVDRYMTQHIALMLAQLFKLNVLNDQDTKAVKILNNARNYCNESVKTSFNSLKKAVEEGRTKWEDNHLDFITLHYLYTEYVLQDRIDDPEVNKIRTYYFSQIQKYWHNDNIYWEGLCAMILHFNPQSNATVNAKLIAESLRQRAIVNDELGMYWKNSWNCYWYQMPVESQALMIELFHEVDKDFATVDLLKIWLLKNKQTTHWKTTKATSAAIYALLAFGKNYIEENKDVVIEMNQKPIDFGTKDIGSGYSKKVLNGTDINAYLGNVKVSNPNTSIAWGAIYYQYFEQLDKIESSVNSPLVLLKEVYLKKNTDKGPSLTKIEGSTTLKVGDIMTSRIIIKVDRDMEYVHLKDMRASGLEVIDQLSGYKWKGGLGYYESPGDLATHFFIQWLSKGTYVLEYDTRASQIGIFSNGISTIQSMYAPEFAAHSKGINLNIGK